MSECPPADVLAAFVDGKLVERELAELEGHLDDCPRCLDLVGDAASTAGEERDVATRETRAAKGRTRFTGVFDVGPRFELVGPLGAGGMGMVFEARDRSMGGRRVALKLLPQTDGGSEHAQQEAARLLRFKREFRALAEVTHPNLVRLFDLVEHGGLWMFTMELVAGQSFLAFTRPGGVVAMDRLVAALAQLAGGVAALHRMRIVHRDLKPSNVLVTEEGTVKILDFGLVGDVSGERLLTATDGIVGTIGYMAPEQASGLAAGPPSDAWAVGVMLYQALTGKLPHEGTALEVMTAKQRGVAIPPRALAPDTPVDLDVLCMRLLSANPDDRPDLPAVLDTVEALAKSPPRRPTERADAAPSEAPLLGRTVELAMLERALGASRNAPTLAFVVGESGIGKSALVATFLASAEAQGARVFAGRCNERESIPYRALDGAIDALGRHLKHLGEHAVRRIAPRRSDLLVRLFPVLGHARGLSPVTTEPIDGETRAHAAFGAMRELLAALAADAPTIVSVDDVQWADDDSLALLHELLQPVGGPRVLFVATLRVGSGLGEQLLRDTLDVDPVRIALSPLPAAAAAELARRLGAGDRAEDVARAAGGHPLFLRELAADSGTRELVTFDAVTSRRVAEQSEVRRRLVQFACIAAAPLDIGELADAVGLQAADVVTHVDALEHLHLLRPAPGGAVEPWHDRVRDVVEASLSDEGRRTLHERLCVVLEERGASLERILPHLRGAGHDARALVAATELAARARNGFAFAEAARLESLALSFVDGSDLAARCERTSRIAEDLSRATRALASAEAYVEAARLADRLRPSSSRPTEEWRGAELRAKAIDQLIRCGRFSEAIASLGGALAPMRITVPRSTVGTILLLVAYRAWLAVRGFGFRERPEASCSREDVLRVDLCFSVANALFSADVLRRALLLARHLSLSLALGEPRRIARGLTLEAASAMSYASARERARGRRVLARAEEVSAPMNDPELRARIELTRGIAANMEGRFVEASQRCRRASEIAEHLPGHYWERAAMRVQATLADAWRGRFVDLAPRVHEMMRDAEEQSDGYVFSHVAVGAGLFVALAEDDVARHRSRVLRAVETQPRTAFSVFATLQRVALASMDLYEDEPLRAASNLEGTARAAARILFFSVVVTELTGRVALATARKEGATEALRSTERAAARLEAIALPWPSAHAALLRAGTASVRGRTDAAIAKLEEAACLFDDNGIETWAACARHRLAELRGSSPSRALRELGVAAPDRLARVFVPM